MVHDGRVTPIEPTRSTWQTPSPEAAVFPGVLGTFVGFWMLTDGGPLPLAWVFVVVGMTFLLTGVIAKGVAWGLALHAGPDDR